MKTSLDLVMEKMKSADMVLVGFGEEFCLNREELIGDNKIYQAFFKEISLLPVQEQAFIFDCIYMHELRRQKNQRVRELIKSYDELWELLREKNYFVVTTCSDDVIGCSQFPADRVVCPCGTRRKMQCENGCGNSLLDTEEIMGRLYVQLETMLADNQGKFEGKALERYFVRCEKCQAYMETNLAGTKNYNEQGYLKDWERYTMWLQGTLNRELCILELGVGFTYPTVIRWPFEKVAALNQKAFLIRVHQSLSQTAKEIQGKSLSFAIDGAAFIKKLMEEKINVYEKEENHAKPE